MTKAPLKITILGCGASGGVPRVGGQWGACDPTNPRNARLRCSVLVERMSARGRTTVLIDTSPDLRQQLLAAGVKWIDGVLYTHDHADHTHGIDDLRFLAYARKRLVDVHFDETTGASLTARFAYCFATQPGSNYRPIVKAHTFAPLRPFTIDGAGGPIDVLPFPQEHGATTSFGFRIGDFAYSSDLKRLPAASREVLSGLELWIVGALRYNTHISHLSVAEALALIAEISPARAILTHLHDDLDYGRLAAELPQGIAPAHDGLVLTVP